MFRKKFRLMSQQEYQALRQDAEVIEKDGHGEKVLRLPDGTYLKLFRRKRLISSAAWYPYAHRFVDNAEKLKKLGFICPTVIDTFRLLTPKRDVVRYEPIPGESARSLLQNNRLSPANIESIKALIADLHAKGVYFRSLHFGNIVIDQKGKLGLIDISDLVTKKTELSSWHKKRNLSQLKKDQNIKNILKL